MIHVNILEEDIAENGIQNGKQEKHARVAQWLEHWSSKPGVDSSILSSGIKISLFFAFFLFLFCYVFFTTNTQVVVYDVINTFRIH